MNDFMPLMHGMSAVFHTTYDTSPYLYKSKIVAWNCWKFLETRTNTDTLEDISISCQYHRIVPREGR